MSLVETRADGSLTIRQWPDGYSIDEDGTVRTPSGRAVAIGAMAAEPRAGLVSLKGRARREWERIREVDRGDGLPVPNPEMPRRWPGARGLRTTPSARSR